MHLHFPRARSWVQLAWPAIALMAGCDQPPTDPAGPPLTEARGGRIVYEKLAFSSNREGAHSIYIRDLDGIDLDQRVTTPPAGHGDSEPDFAPGNRSLVFTRFAPNGKSELFTVALNGKRLRQLTSFGALTQNAAYSPDGSRIAFVSDKDGPMDVYVMDSDGSNVQRITTTSVGDYHPTWSPDGTRLAYASGAGSGSRIWVRYTSNWGGESLLECPTSWCINPTWSRNDNRIVYQFSPTPFDPPVLKLLNLDTGENVEFAGYPSARVGGWKPNGTRFVFVTNGEAALYSADTQTMSPGQFYAFPSPDGTVMWPTWSR